MARCLVRLLTIGLILAPLVWCMAQTAPRPLNRKSPKARARPKTFTPEEIRDTFFDDVFAVVVGSRPGARRIAGSPAADAPSMPPPASTSSSPSSTPSSLPASPPSAAPGKGPEGITQVPGWKETISSQTIESEIEAIKVLIDQYVTTPADFSGGGYKDCRAQFSVAAMLFAIIQEYDGEVRWKTDAAAARDALARTAANCNAGSPDVYAEAKQRKGELEDLVGGKPFPMSGTQVGNDWATICGRAPLMRRLEAAFETEIRTATEDEGAFTAAAAKLKHEAEMIRAISEVLGKSGMDDGDNSNYRAFSRQLKEGARDLLDGVNANDFAKARSAVGMIDNACNSCHDDFRN